jgi:prepilin-type N-terminal cleavage/methylation domain-containing protein
MRSESIGSRAALWSASKSSRARQGGFTLLEALVALGVILIFAAALGPFLFQARRIISNADERLAAQNLLRSLVANPMPRPSWENPLREGETDRLRWRIVAEPMIIGSPPQADPPKSTAFRVTMSVSWGLGQSVIAETVQLGRPK